MPTLVRLDNSKPIGTISDVQLKFLVDELEEDHEDDREYFLDRETLELLSDNGADPELIAMLEKAMGNDDELALRDRVCAILCGLLQDAVQPRDAELASLLLFHSGQLLLRLPHLNPEEDDTNVQQEDIPARGTDGWGHQ